LTDITCLGEEIHAGLARAIEAIAAVGVIADSLGDGVRILLATLRGGGRVLICGNGGSAAMAQHFAAELVGRFERDRRPFPAIALTDIATITAIGNDYAFVEIFARQIAAIGNPGDTLIALSTSGNSANVVAALRQANALGMKTIGFTGLSECLITPLCDVVVQAPGTGAARIQEMHLIALHVTCGAVERALIGEP
jgi:D-sedoheptulose 7-phosphate isomerase